MFSINISWHGEYSSKVLNRIVPCNPNNSDVSIVLFKWTNIQKLCLDRLGISYVPIGYVSP